jgi:hypothetical protein
VYHARFKNRRKALPGRKKHRTYRYTRHVRRADGLDIYLPM